MKKICLSPGSNRGPLVCETSVITDYTTQTSISKFINKIFKKLFSSPPSIFSSALLVGELGRPRRAGEDEG